MRGLCLTTVQRLQTYSHCNLRSLTSSHSGIRGELLRLRLASTLVLGKTEDPGASSTEVKPYTALPGPPSYPFIGCIPALYKEGGTKKFHITVRKFRERYGDVYRMNIFGMNTVAVGDPDITQEIYRNEGKYPEREPHIPAWHDYHKDRNLCLGIFVMTGEEWWLHRSAVNPKMLKIKQVEQYGPAINAVSDEAIETIMARTDSSGVVICMESLLPKWSLESAATAMFERRLGSFHVSPDPRSAKFVNATQGAMHDLLKVSTEITPLARLFGSKARKSLFANLDTMYRIGTEMTHEKLKEFKEKETANALDEDAACEFIPYLYHVKKMDVTDICSDICSLLFAAVETTSTTVLWALYYLGTNKDKQEMLRRELKASLGDTTFISTQSLQNLPYLKAVVKETLRCGAIVGMNSRIFSEEVIINGCKTPKNTMFILLHDAMGKDPKYFEDPNSFLPERWLRDNDRKESGIQHPFVSLPFGFGRRMCLGRRLAELEIQILIGKIIHQYEVECLQRDVGSIMQGLVKPEIPLQFKFKKLDS